MATIKELEELQFDKIENSKLKQQVKEVIQGYNEAIDKEDYLEAFKPNINKIYEYVEKYFPEAIKSPLDEDCPCDEEESKSTKNEKKASKPNKPKKSSKKKTKASPTPKATKKDLEELEEQIKMCRVKIKQYNEEKRKGEPKKKPPTRYEKIKGHIISLENLIPDRLKNNIKAQKESKRLMQSTHRKLLEIYGMTALEGKNDNKELQERLDKIEEKLEA